MVSGLSFSAAASALGYLYQVRYGLVLLLEAKNPASALSLERIDDVAFEESGDPTQVLQFKHRLNRAATLTDSSVDLWKTLRVWATKIADGELDSTSTILSFVTTAVAPENSAAALLRRDSNRNETDALTKLREAGSSSENKTIVTAFEAFDALSPEAQERLVSSIVVLDSAPDIERARQLLEQALFYSTRPEFLAPLCDRLEGWWFRLAVSHLRAPQAIPSISLAEVRYQLADLQEQFRLDNLPIDFPLEQNLDESDLQPGERMFVEQLRLVLVGHERIKRAISDYWRAFEQRSKWVREDLIVDADLEQYEDRLIREWQELFLIMKEKLTEGSDSAVEGRALYNRVVIEGNHIPIRPAFPNPYVMRGSFHILANALKIGWHPLFRERLTKTLEIAATAAK
jgi:hypothetical protein